MIESGTLWHKLEGYSNNRFLIGAGSPPGKDTEVSAKGIVQGHAYAVLRAVSEKDHRGMHHLVQLRNPWAHGEWKGAWSDGDSVNWTKRMW